MRAAVYCRVSRAANADNTSIPNQQERCKSYIEAQGWELVETYIEPGESGENLDRPEMTKARQAALRGEYDLLVIYTLDRLTRDIDDLFLLRREFKSVSFKSWSVYDRVEVTSANPDDLLQIVIKGYTSHRERLDIARRLRDGIEATVKAGKWGGGRTPYGYRRDPGTGRLVIYEPEAATVRNLYTWLCDEGLSSYEIAQRLDALDIPTPQAARGQKAKRRNDGTQAVPSGWTSASVRHIVKSEIYVGRYTFGKQATKHDPITVDLPDVALVDRATFDAAQAALVRNRKYTARPKYKYLLRGLIRCECNAAFCGQTPVRNGKVYPPIYVCLARKDYRKKKRPHRCESATVPGEELERVVWDDIQEFIRQPHLVAAELFKNRDNTDDTGRELARIDQAIATKQQELNRYLRLYGRGGMDIAAVEDLIQEAKAHIKGLEAYRAQLLEQQHQADLWEQEIASIIEALAALQHRLDEGMTWEDKQAVVELLVKGIVIETRTDEAGKLYPIAHITYRFEQPQVDAPIPAELVPLFGDVSALTSTLNSAIISRSITMELSNAQHD